MTSKTTRRPAKRRVRLHRMSKRAKASTIEGIYNTSKRSLETVQATRESLMAHKSMSGSLGIVEAVLNRQIIELGYIAGQSKRLAEDIGLAV